MSFSTAPLVESRQDAQAGNKEYTVLSLQEVSAVESANEDENPLYQLSFFPVSNIDSWYEAFTVKNTAAFVIKESWHVAFFYAIYAGIVLHLAHQYPETFSYFHSSAVLKVMILLTGLLISFVLKESIDTYRKCVSAMVDFTDEFKVLWYMSQQPLLRRLPPAQIIVHMHMVLFAVSLARFLMQKAGIELPDPDLMVQSEFRECTMFKNHDQYGAASSNPAYAEMLLVSWLRACGILNGELRKHIEWTRQKLRTVLTEKQVKSPGTAGHLLNIVTHVFLLAIPWCVRNNMSRFFLPLVAVVLFSLLKLAHELEDPFGVDRHDLPWPVMLGNVSYCTLCQESKKYVKETVAAFNHACINDEWLDPQALFGQNYVNTEAIKNNKFDTGRLQLDLYLTLPKLQRLEVVSSEVEMEPDALFSQNSLKARNSMYKLRSLDMSKMVDKMETQQLNAERTDTSIITPRGRSCRTCAKDNGSCSIS